MIYTSYFGKMNKLPKDIVPVSICNNAPEFFKGIQMKKLGPSYGLLTRYKKNQDNEFYEKYFKDNVLGDLSASRIIQELENIGNGSDVVLLCYEKSGDFCHRHLVAEWLTKNGCKCEEMMFDE